MKLLFSLFLLLSRTGEANELGLRGRIAHSHPQAKLYQIAVVGPNFKFIQMNEILDSYIENTSMRPCKIVVMGKTSTHVLVKLQGECSQASAFIPGAIIRLESAELKKNLQLAQNFNSELLRKIAILKGVREKQLAEVSHYQVMRDTLESEYRAKILKIEEEKLHKINELEALRSKNSTALSSTNYKLSELEVLLEKYRIEDPQLNPASEHIWSIDSNLTIIN